MARKIARNVTVMDIGSNDVITYFTECTYNYTNMDEDGKGAVDRHERPVAVGSNSSLEVGAHVEGTAALMNQARSNPAIAVNFTIEGTAYTSVPGLITTAKLTANRNSLQSQNVTIKLDEN